MTRFEIYVVAGSARPGPDGRYGGTPRLRVKSPPADGRANAEAERLLSDLLGSQVRLARGARSPKKVFEIDLGEVVLEARLAARFGP